MTSHKMMEKFWDITEKHSYSSGSEWDDLQHFLDVLVPKIPSKTINEALKDFEKQIVEEDDDS